MVDVGDKPVTLREAVARGEVRMLPETLTKIVEGQNPNYTKNAWEWMKQIIEERLSPAVASVAVESLARVATG